ncbi:MAG: hypothetical protein K2V38_04595, partial [Gemmataceae bacterium]|nr:hypothetical protein [Gemmataceae bacterium]
RVLHLHFPDGELIRTTPEHPFWVEGTGWTPAGELREGDRLATLSGEWVPLAEVYDTDQWEPVYNVRVADWHTYFVGDEGWGFSAWAHNLSCDEIKEVIKAGKQQPLTDADCTQAAQLATAKDGPALYAFIRQKYPDLKDRPASEIVKAILAKAGVNPTTVNDGLEQIAQYRANHTLGEYVQKNTHSGTVARLQIGSPVFWGSSKNLSTRVLLQTEIDALYGGLGMPPGLSPELRQFLQHAEFEALWKAKQSLGTLPEVLTMYVDRPTCMNCTDALPWVMKAWGVKEMFIYWTNGQNLPRLLTAQQ